MDRGGVVMNGSRVFGTGSAPAGRIWAFGRNERAAQSVRVHTYSLKTPATTVRSA